MLNRFAITTLLCLSTIVVFGPAPEAAPVAVRFVEGVTHGFLVLRSLSGDRLANGEVIQVARDNVVESRLIFRFRDGSIYDETIIFSQRDVFTLQTYRLVQRGPAFPESIAASIDRTTGQYDVRYRADEDSPEEVVSGRIELPADVYNGMLSLLMKNFTRGERQIVQIVLFTPQPRLVKLMLEPTAEDELIIAERPILATRYLIKPQLGLLASLLVIDPPPMQCWVIGGEAPAFIKFQGPLYFMGPVWRIELN